MNGKSQSGSQGQGQKPGSNKTVLLLGIFGVAALLVAIAVFKSGSTRNSGDAAQVKSTTTPGSAPGASGNPGKDATFGATTPSEGAHAPKQQTPKQVVGDIVDVASMTNEVTLEQAKKFHDGLNELVRQGAASVPAIQDYLDKNLDSNYGQVKGAEELGYSSVRHALLDTLKQIGGPEAEASMSHVLQTTAEPNEVAEIAKDLEQIAPGQHRDESLQAAKEALDMAYNGQLGSNIERGPLFRVFQIYGASYAAPGATTQ